MKLTLTLNCLPQDHYGCIGYPVVADLVLHYSSGTASPF